MEVIESTLKGLIEEESVCTENIENVKGFNIGELENALRELASDNDIKICSKCNKLMIEGYCIESGFDYYCSFDCLASDMDISLYMSLYDDGNGDSYWTEWECYNPTIYAFLKKSIDSFPGLNLKY